MMITIKSHEDRLKECVRTASDLLRGRVSASEYKDYITALLFFKYVSDVRESFAENFGQIEDLYSKQLSRLQLANPTAKTIFTFRGLWRNELSERLGDRLNSIFHRFEQDDPVELNGVFSLVDFNSNRLGNPKERGELLASLMASLDTASVFVPTMSFQGGSVFDFLNITMETLATHRHNTEHVTPTCLSKIMARLLAPLGEERILDPFCGTGSLLVQCIAEANKSSSFAPQVFGIEKSGASWSIARMNAFVHGSGAKNILLADAFSALAEYERKDTQFDIIITNPPWALKPPINTEERYAKYFSRHRNPKLNGDYAALGSMLAVLHPRRGRLAIIVTNGFLTKGGAEHDMRRNLVERNLIDSVISLPPKLFYNSSVAASILFLRMDRTAEAVLFIDASKDFISLKSRNQLTEAGVEKLFTVFNAREEIESYSCASSIARISDNDFNLSVSNYISNEQILHEPDLVEISQRRYAVRSRLEEIEQRFAEFIIDSNF
jgi:type I restriction enzyme M protein